MADQTAVSIRVPLAVTLNIEQFSGATVTQFSSYMKNAVVEQVGPEPDQKQFIRQRPAFAGVTDNTTSKTKGRGIFFWDTNSTLYFVNDDTVYRGSYTSVGTVTTGSKKCYFTQVGTRLLVTDPENSDGYTIQTDHTFTAITDPQFPTTLSHGVVTLNGRGYVMDTTGDIYGSDSEDPTSWTALNVINAEREPDGGIYLGKHYDHIVAFGPKTIEFFYDNANPTGSPLSRRVDVFYNVGAISGESIWQVGDIIYFLGTEAKGSVNIYKLEGFQLTKISDYGINTYLSNLIYREQKGCLFSGFQAQGRTYLLVTPYNTLYTSRYYTFVYSAETEYWHWFSSAISDIGDSNSLGIVDWTLRTGTTASLARGITAEGVIVAIYDAFIAVDYEVGAYVFTGYWVTGYAVGDTVSSSNIPVTIRTGPQDGKTNKYKYARSLEIAGDYADAATNVTVTWSDTVATDASFTGGNRTIDLSTKRKLTRCGRFIKRSHQLTYTSNQPLRLEALEIDVAKGSN